jgi:transposase-like protein
MNDTTEYPFIQTESLEVDTQEAGRATEVLTTQETKPSSRTTSEVVEKAIRRRYTADYKQRILTEADSCIEPGQIGKLLRREGLYSSHLSKWRTQRDAATIEGLSQSRGRKPLETSLLAEENIRLLKENKSLQRQLTPALTIIDFQKKLSQLLGLSEITLTGEMS